MSRLDELRKQQSSTHSQSIGTKLDRLRSQKTDKSLERPVRPTRIMPTPNMDITKSPLMQTVEEDRIGDYRKQLDTMQAEDNPKHFETDRNAMAGVKARNLPVIGPVLKGLDYIAEKTDPVADIARSFYIPGAGAANVASFVGASENALARLAPKLANSAAGKFGSQLVAPGVPFGVGSVAQNNPNPTLKDFAIGGLEGAAGGAVLGGLGKGIGAGLGVIADRYAGTKIGDALGRMMGRGSQAVEPTEQVAQDILALPQGRGESRYNAALNRSNLTPNESPIMGTGTVRRSEPLGLPEPNIGAPTRARVEVRPNEYTQKLENLFNTANKMKFTPGRELEELESLWSQMAGPKDPKLDELIDLAYPKQVSKVSADSLSKARTLQQSREVAGVPNKVKGLNDRYQPLVGDAGMPRERVGAIRSARDVQPEVTVPLRRFSPVERMNSSPAQLTPLTRNSDELGFAQTVRSSANTSPEAVQRLTETPLMGNRTTNAADLQRAHATIQRKGIQGATNDLLNSRKVSSVDNMIAQELMQHYQTVGDIDSFLSVLNKTAKENRFMGQAIQALSRWNKLDADGAALLANKIINKGKTADEAIDLTAEQLLPITAATKKVANADKTTNLAEEVMNIVTKKADGQPLTPEELATIKEFQSQVNEINSKVKGFLPDKATTSRKVVSEVNKVEPANRTREQLKDYWDARAELARQKLAKQRNIGLTPNTENPVLLYAEIGLAKLAKGIIKADEFAESMLRDYGSSIKPMISQIYDRSVNMFRKSQGLPTQTEFNNVINTAIKNNKLDKEQASSFKGWAKEIAFYTDDNLRTEAIQDLQLALKSLGTSTLGEKVATLQTGAMLLNPVTILRNVIGNAGQLVSEKVSKLSTVPIDWALSKFTGERTVKFNPMNQAEFWVDFMKATKGGYKGVSSTGTLDSYGIKSNTFGDRNPLRYVSKLLGASLQGFDTAFYNAAKGEVLATYGEMLGKSQGLTREQIKADMPQLIKQLDEKIHDLADHAGLYATYQDETFLSKGSELLKRGLNDLSTGIASRKLVEAGLPKKYSMEGFGLGDMVNKFAKTPANLVMRGLDYSPIGFIRAAMELAPLIPKIGNRAKFNQYEASRALGRAITGSLGLSGMGYILADAGILSGSYSLDKDERSIQEQSGRGSYKVNLSALKRFMLGAFDYSAAKYQKGDTLMDYAWLQPAAISVAMGVNANRAVKDRKLEDETTGWKTAQKVVLGGIGSILENPMVQGLNNLIDAGVDIVRRQDPTKLKNIGKSGPSTFVPTILNQFRTATDNKQRETFSKSLLTEMGNLMANKVPGLSNNLPVSYDSLGNARERVQGGQENSVSQYLTAFFSPAKLTEYQVSPEAKLVLELMEQSGDRTVLPRVSNKYINISQGKNTKDLRVNLTAEEYSQLQRTVGKLVMDKLSSQSNYLSDPNKSLESKVKKVKDILTATGQKARDEIGTKMGYQKKDIR